MIYYIQIYILEVEYIMRNNIHTKTVNCNLGIDMLNVPAFSIEGIWDHNHSSHLNIHFFHQVLVVHTGVFMIEDDTFKQPLYKHNAAFIPANKAHKIYLVSEHSRSEAVCYSLFFKKKYIKKQIEGIKLFQISDLNTALLQKLNEVNLINLTYGIMGRCLDLFLEILNLDIEKEAPLIRLPEAKTDFGKKIIQYIEKNYMNNINFSDFASIISYSPRHTSRLFQEDLGISVFEYLRLYRILVASIELDKKDKKIIDIALDCGYNSLSSFYSDFKIYYSITPSQFRKKHFE